MEDIRQAAGIFVQMHFSAFNPAHVQYVVDKAQQMVPGRHDFFQVPFHLLPVIKMGDGKGRKAHNGIHGGADVMGHIGKENAFRLVGPVSLHQGIFQQVLFLHLPARFLVHAAEAQHNAMLPAPFPYAHCF